MFKMNQVLAVCVVISGGWLSSGCGAAPDGSSSDPGTDLGHAEESLISYTGSVIYDSGTQCTVGGATMHCCPNGYVMIGARVDQNVFKCAQLSSAPGARFLDIGTQRNNMHACPFGQLMVGLHAGNNWLVCQSPGTTVTSEFVDTGTQDGFPMHVCAGSFAMGGIRIDQNRFTCDF